MKKIIGYLMAFGIVFVVTDKVCFDLWVDAARRRELTLTDRLVALTSPWWILRKEMWEGGR